MQFASRRAFLFAAAATVLAVPAHAANGPAAQLIEKVAAEVIELIKTTQGAQREAGIRAVLERYFDLPYMGRAALATHWDGTTGVSVVTSKLTQTSGQPIGIQWEVRDSGQGLRITDVKIEGVSMVMTRRSDFNSYIQNNGGKVDALIGELERRAGR
jgi:phospholipid transport system substrate-binding protein